MTRVKHWYCSYETIFFNIVSSVYWCSILLENSVFPFSVTCEWQHLVLQCSFGFASHYICTITIHYSHTTTPLPSSYQVVLSPNSANNSDLSELAKLNFFIIWENWNFHSVVQDIWFWSQSRQSVMWWSFQNDDVTLLASKELWMSDIAINCLRHYISNPYVYLN